MFDSTNDSLTLLKEEFIILIMSAVFGFLSHLIWLISLNFQHNVLDIYCLRQLYFWYNYEFYFSGYMSHLIFWLLSPKELRFFSPIFVRKNTHLVAMFENLCLLRIMICRCLKSEPLRFDNLINQFLLIDIFYSKLSNILDPICRGGHPLFERQQLALVGGNLLFITWCLYDRPIWRICAAFCSSFLLNVYSFLMLLLICPFACNTDKKQASR